MINAEFNKKCNATILDKQLRDAGFDIFGVSTSGDQTIIHMKDTETGDPTAKVNSHAWTPDAKPRDVITEFDALKKKLIDTGVITS